MSDDLERAQVILVETSEAFAVPLADMIGRGRTAELTEARREAIARIWHDTDLTLAQIGALLGGRDHSTICHYLRVHDLKDAAA